MKPRRFRDIAEELGFTWAFLNLWLTGQRRGPINNPDAEMDADMEEFIRRGFSPPPPMPKNLWLREFRVGGFKAFAEEQKIPLGRITLVFGPNSAGKSSLLHSLLLAHEATTSGQLDVHEPQLAEGSIDLGGFHQFTHCQQIEKHPITLEFNVRPNELNEMFRDRCGGVSAYSCDSVAVHLVFGLIPSHAEDDSQRGRPGLLRLDVTLDSIPVCQVGRTREGKLKFRSVDLTHPFFARLASDYADLMRPVTAKPGEVSNRVLRMMELVVTGTSLDAGNDTVFPGSASFEYPESGKIYAPDSITDPDGLTDEEHLADFAEEEADAREAAERPFVSIDDPDREVVEQLMTGFSLLLGEFVHTACAPIRSNLEALTYLGPLRSFPARDFTLTHTRDAHWHAGGGFAWDVLAKDEGVRALVNEWFASKFLKTPYQFVVTDLVSGEIVASAIESEFADIVSEKSQEHEEKRGSQDDSDEEGFYFPYDNWDTDELGKRLSSKALERAKSSRRTELRLIDKRTGAKVSHRDVGVGLSQILPILVRALSETEKLHLIEQPEIHIHPALQAELGDVFINSALGDSQNRFLIETHSEHLILRILKRIRQTTSDQVEEGQSPVQPEDVSVLYVLPDKTGSKVYHLPIDETGRFIDEWPGGFFAERLDEVF